jgi:N utilization substance protein B
MQLLYAMDITGDAPGVCLPGVLESAPIPDEMRKYGMDLVDFVLENRSRLDTILRSQVSDWDPERMAVIDRLVISVALAELLHSPDVPVKVAIQEAVQIAHKYSNEDESGKFVNGILHGFAKSEKML